MTSAPTKDAAANESAIGAKSGQVHIHNIRLFVIEVPKKLYIHGEGSCLYGIYKRFRNGVGTAVIGVHKQSFLFIVIRY